MNDQHLFLIGVATLAICGVAGGWVASNYQIQKQRLYTEHGYTQTTLPGHTQVYWVNPNASNTIPSQPVR